MKRPLPASARAILATSLPLIVFDGVCVVCSASAQFVLRHDRAGRFRLTTAQSDLGCALYGSLGLPTDSQDTMLLVQDGCVLTHSDTVIAVATGLGWPWRAAGAARLIPERVRDRLYLGLARNRYRWFGRRETCWLPSPADRARIL